MKKYVFACFTTITIAGFVFQSTSCGGSAALKVSVDTVLKREIIETVTASGKIQPEVEVKISSDVSGEIVELYVKEGDSVTQGQLLLVVNPDIYISEYDRMQAVLNNSKAALATSEARLEQSKSQLLQAELNYKRNKTLHDKKAISDSEWEQIETNYKVAQSEVKAAERSVEASDYNVKSTQASLKTANDNLKRTQIFAPMSGIISMLNVEKGERIVGTAQMAGTEMLRIANLSVMEVNVEVNENDIVKVDLGDTAIIEVDAYLGKKFKGVVTEIANSAKNDAAALSTDQVTNFAVKIRILSESYLDLIKGKKGNYSPFRPGMSANVEVQTAQDKAALSVPIPSVTTRGATSTGENQGPAAPTLNANGEIKEYVFVVAGDTVKMVEVETGIQDNKYIAITKGLEENQVVVEGPYKVVSSTLKEGDKVKPVSKDELYKSPGQ